MSLRFGEDTFPDESKMPISSSVLIIARASTPLKKKVRYIHYDIQDYDSYNRFNSGKYLEDSQLKKYLCFEVMHKRLINDNETVSSYMNY